MAGSLDLSVLAGVAVLVGTVALFARLTWKRKPGFRKVGTVSSLHLYPVKSCGVMQLQEGYCSDVGLCYQDLKDRHWMVITADTRQPVTLYSTPKMILIHPYSTGEFLTLKAPDMPDLKLPKKPELDGAQSVTYDDQDIQVIDCGTEAAEWVSKFLGKETRLVFSCKELDTRDVYTMERDWDHGAKPGDMTVFNSITSYLVTCEASLRKVNSLLEKPVPMKNFRTNIAVENDVEFEEDNWKQIKVGQNVMLRTVEPCTRCPMTTVDTKRGVRDEGFQPLKLLKSFRCKEKYGKSPIFGALMTLDCPGTVMVGDPVFALVE